MNIPDLFIKTLVSFLKFVPYVKIIMENNHYKKKYSSTLSIANKFVCEMQGSYIAYNHTLSDTHRKMKNALRTCEKEQNRESLETLKEKIKDFNNAGNDGLSMAAKKVFNAMETLFDERNNERPCKPRFCIKMVRENNVFILSRNKGVDFSSPAYEHPQENDMALSTIQKTGEPFLQNDIPAAVRAGNYKTPRLDNTLAINYEDNRLLRWIGSPKKEDTKWALCWRREDGAAASDPGSCYKSTLVVPVSLRGNEMPSDFKERFGAPDQPGGYKNLTFAFLCMDSHYPDFFDESDKKFGYIFSDVFSLFVVAYLTLSEFSQAYGRATLLIEKKEQQPQSSWSTPDTLQEFKT